MDPSCRGAVDPKSAYSSICCYLQLEKYSEWMLGLTHLGSSYVPLHGGVLTFLHSPLGAQLHLTRLHRVAAEIGSDR